MTPQERAEIGKLLEIEIPLHFILHPQDGPQTTFDECEADITVFGGSAGGGKTFALLREPTKHIDNPGFGAVIFRRTMKQVKDEGGIWDQSAVLFPFGNAKPNLTERFWSFPSGATVQFAGLEHEHDKIDWQGAEICYLEFDELTHFTASQFFYLISRNRSTCGVKPRVKASCNPEPGWVKNLLAPWVDKTFPNPAASGEIRYFVRGEADQIVWLDEKPIRPPCRCLKYGCENCFPPEKSITFIRSSVYDNKKLLEKDPGYISNLLALTEVERRRLHDGDWDAKLPHLMLDAYQEGKHKVPWRKIPDHWRVRAVGSDFGGINAANIFVAEDPDSPGPRKNLYVFAEDWPGHSRSTKTICDTIRELCGGTPTLGCGGNKTVEQGSVESYKLHGIPLTLPKFRDAKMQYQCVNDEFFADRLFIMENCVKTIAMIESFQRKLNGNGDPTDEFDDGNFHLLAALRYIISKLRPPKASRTVQVKVF